MGNDRVEKCDPVRRASVKAIRKPRKAIIKPAKNIFTDVPAFLRKQNE
jgi:hypothetical protein